MPYCFSGVFGIRIRGKTHVAIPYPPLQNPCEAPQYLDEPAHTYQTRCDRFASQPIPCVSNEVVREQRVIRHCPAKVVSSRHATRRTICDG